MAWYRVDKPSTAGSAADVTLSARECAAAAVWKDRILVSNGNDASSRFRDLLEFSPRTLTIEKHASAQNGAQTPVSAHSFATCDGRFFYQFGGWDGSRDIASLFRYDAERRTWSSIPPVGDMVSVCLDPLRVGAMDRSIALRITYAALPANLLGPRPCRSHLATSTHAAA